MKLGWALLLLLGCNTATGEDVVYQRCLDQMQVVCERLFACNDTKTYATQADCTTTERMKCETFTSLSACDGHPDRYSGRAHTQCLDDLKTQQCPEVGTEPDSCATICSG